MNSRRDFLKWTGTSVVALVAGQLFIGETVEAEVARVFRSIGTTADAFGLPQFEGVYIFDPAAVADFAKDFGRNVKMTPLGVLQPKNTSDVQLLLLHAQKTKTAVAIRGTGGAAYGQTQIQDGYLIDTSSLKELTWISKDVVKLGPGLIWKEVVAETFPKGFVPFVLPDTIVTSVGGTASVGGIGETSIRYGAMIDHVVELEIVLMDGTVETCGRVKNASLFESILGGMGQFAAITGVTTKLMSAPLSVFSRDYEFGVQVSHSDILKDLEQLAQNPSVMALGGHFVRKAGTDEFTYLVHVSLFNNMPQGEEVTLIHGTPTGPWRSAGYLEYANRNTKGWDTAVAGGLLEFPKPYMSFYLPWSNTESFLNELKKNPDWSLGAGRIYFAPLVTSHFGNSTMSLPGESLVSHIRLYKIVRNGAFGADHLKILSLNEKEILPAVFKAGGTVYLPFSPLLSKAQEVQQLGFAEWTRLSALKVSLDPSGLLNLNAGLFHD